MVDKRRREEMRVEEKRGGEKKRGDEVRIENKKDLPRGQAGEIR